MCHSTLHFRLLFVCVCYVCDPDSDVVCVCVMPYVMILCVDVLLCNCN